ncbi:MAG TPA: HAD family phosphatase [Puia sp.]|nr:HAD family phosphatase [Puia sp.]
MLKQPKAFLFDLNGTMINDMNYHIDGWLELLNTQLNAGMTRDEVKQQMYGKNSEVLTRIFGENHFTIQEMDRLSIEKEKAYQAVYKTHLALVPGLSWFLQKSSDAGILMAIGSAAIPFNIDFVLDNLHIRHYFKAIVSADDVKLSKPNPETYTRAAALLGTAPGDCVVFEDAPKGAEAAFRASMSCIVLTTMHTAEEFSLYPNILHFIADYNDPFLGSFLPAD